MLIRDTIRNFYDESSRLIWGSPKSMFPSDLLPLLDRCIAAGEAFKRDESLQNRDEYWKIGSQLGDMIQTGVEGNYPDYQSVLLKNCSVANQILREGCNDQSSDTCKFAKFAFSVHINCILQPREIELDRNRPILLRKYPELHR